MSAPIVVHVGRTTKVTVSLGVDVSGDTITSQVRKDKNSSSTLIANWAVSPLTDGQDGEIVLTMDDAVTSLITAKKGYMDLKRVSGGEPISVFNEPLEVHFRGVVSA